MCAFKWNCPFYKFYAWTKSFTKVKLNLYERSNKIFFIPSPPPPVYVPFSSYSTFNEWKFLQKLDPNTGNSMRHEWTTFVLHFLLLLLSVNWINFIPHTHNFFSSSWSGIKKSESIAYKVFLTLYSMCCIYEENENVDVVKKSTYLRWKSV